MARVFFSEPLSLTEEKVWVVAHSSTLEGLLLVNKTGTNNPNKISWLYADLAPTVIGNHCFIFINRFRSNSKTTRGIFLNKQYGYTVVEGTEIFGAFVGGEVGERRSQFGIYVLNTLIGVDRGNNSQDDSLIYYRLTKDGWQKVEAPVFAE